MLGGFGALQSLAPSGSAALGSTGQRSTAAAANTLAGLVAAATAGQQSVQLPPAAAHAAAQQQGNAGEQLQSAGRKRSRTAAADTADASENPEVGDVPVGVPRLCLKR
jgi:hypothetical protein